MPRKVPLAFKLATTNHPERINLNAPAPPPSPLPKPPASLPPDVKTAWREIVAMLKGMNVLTVSDHLALRTFAETLAAKRFAEKSLRDKGGGITYLSETKQGTFYRVHPEIGLINDLDRALRCYYALFGLTPGDRSKVQSVSIPSNNNPYNDL